MVFREPISIDFLLIRQIILAGRGPSGPATSGRLGSVGRGAMRSTARVTRRWLSILSQPITPRSNRATR